VAQASVKRARSSAGEHYVDIVGVTGSIPVAPTIPFNDLGYEHCQCRPPNRAERRKNVRHILAG
jgi:hypothetical protein